MEKSYSSKISIRTYAHVQCRLDIINKLRLFYERWYRNNATLNTNCEAVLKEAYNWVKNVDSPYFIW